MIPGDFSRHLRLTRASEFKQVFETGKRTGDRQLTMLCRANGLSTARLGMVIARKHLKHAVERNRLKRQIRESFRLNQEMLKGRDIVVLLRADVSSQSNQSLRILIAKGWEQVNRQCAISS